MSTALRGPPQPVYVLRGHNAQIHALHFYDDNLRLLSGDADGWVVIWDMVSRRPVAVWRAHEKSILTLRVWGTEKIISHGRDDALRVWHIPPAAESTLSKALPTEGYDVERQSPWLLHSLLVNTMNFCPLAVCQLLTPRILNGVEEDKKIMLAVPGTQDGYIHIHELPSEKCTHIVPPASSITKSLVMAIRLYTSNTTLFLIIGNEAGETSVQAYDAAESKSWTTIYSSRPHTQPVLSLDMAPSQSRYFTSSADATIASHPLPSSPLATSAAAQNMRTTQTGHAGQQSLCVRDDGRIFATAGWDARVRVYSAKASMQEVAVLKWHKEGCYAVAFGSVADAAMPPAAITAEAAEAADGAASAQRQAGERVEDADADGNDDRQSDAMIQVQNVVQGRSEGSLTVKQRREQSTRATHWLAAGAKDGKVSLWDIF